MVKIGVIGAGFMGGIHLNAFKQIDNADVVAIVDSEEQRGKQVAKDAGINYYSDLKNMLKGEDLDVVSVCTPTFLHAEMVKEAAEAGKHIFCEKPLALTLKEADEMMKVVKRNKVKAMVGHVLRFWPDYVEAKRIVDSGELGKAYHAFCERLCVTPAWPWKGWMIDEKYSKGAPVDMHIHDLDYLIWLFGEPKLVKSQGVYSKKLNSYMHIGTTIEFKSGQCGLAEAGYGFKGKFPFTMVLRILCEEGCIDWTYRMGESIAERGQEFALTVYKADGTIYIPEFKKADPYYAECSYLIDCIENDKKIENGTFEQGYRALKLALATIESANEGTVVKL
jgi:UDP-N-acetylglucosamine 3-dehydrogenase